MGNTDVEISGSDDGSDGGAPLNGGKHMDGGEASDTGATTGYVYDYEDGSIQPGFDNYSEPPFFGPDEQGLTVAQRIRPITTHWVKLDGKYDDGETFFPLPLITFGVDNPQNITCRLCRVSELRLMPAGVPRSAPQPPVTDNMPAIMPCGHIAGAVCLADSFEGTEEGEWSCPFCRMHLVYPECGHRVKERVLTGRTIAGVPPTIPMGGEIPDMCPDCRAETLQMDTDVFLNINIHEFKQARETYRFDPDEETALYIMERAEQIRKLCGNAMEEDVKIYAGCQSW